jgi:peroxiredoxin
MRLILTVCLVLLAVSTAFSQDKFRKDYNRMAHLLPSGETSIYRKIEGLEEGYATTGEHYQMITVIDEDGDILRIQLFDDIAVGLKIIFSNNSGMIQFAWF